jgi:Holliday junction resolvase
MNSRAKGKRGELEIAKVLRENGYDAHRGQQYKGGADSPIKIVVKEIFDND